MQKLSVSEEEQMSRKEYLKNKKRQKKNMDSIFKKFTKKKLIVIILSVILIIYVAIQFYIYYKQNNYSYLSDENVDSQKVYNIYYMSEGYTYNPDSSLNSIKSNSFEPTRIYTNLGFEDIKLYNNLILGIKDGLLYSFDLTTQVITKISDIKIKKYALYGSEAYIVPSDNGKVRKIDLTTGEAVEFSKDNVAEILIDDNYVFLCIESTNKKTLYRYLKDGTGEKKLTDSENVSYIVEDANYIYFVNKSDGNKIYKVGKDGGVSKISDDVKSVTDTGSIRNIDGSMYMCVYNNNLYYVNTSDDNCLWKVNLESLESSKVIYSSIDMLQNVEDTVFYKIKNQRGLFLYNLETGFNSEISSRLITEFVVQK